MKICVIGTGYVGLVTGALFSDRGNRVVCVDKKQEVVDLLNSGKIHIFEPGLQNIVQRNKGKTLFFTTNTKKAVTESDLIFLAVGTPSEEDGSFNLKYLKAAAKEVGQALNKCAGFKVVVCKSTVPQGTYNVLSKEINNQIKNPKLKWAYVSNPETLAEGTAVRDFAKPDRIIIGTNSDKAFKLMEELYHPFVLKRDRILRGSPVDAELAKLYSNTALATRISMVNEFARVADNTEQADMEIIRKMVCSDNRIGYNFMFPSPGYGGSCFPKDIQGLVHQSKEHGYVPNLLSKIHPSNEEHKLYIAKRIEKIMGTIKNKKIAIWGLTFKPNTDDMRDSSSIPIVNYLYEKGAKIIAYDPKDNKAKNIFGNKIKFEKTRYKAAEGADVLILLTEWKEFDSPDFKNLKRLMNGNTLMDFRNRWLPDVANRYGFNYYGIGRSYPLKSKK
jgi:UDPglucose 6-dehydrogenase